MLGSRRPVSESQAGRGPTHGRVTESRESRVQQARGTLPGYPSTRPHRDKQQQKMGHSTTRNS
eukprot:2877313-Rhodomonas_salina.1